MESSFEKVPGGRYEIVARLGTGAFGAVYRAQDTLLDRAVAVKSIRLDTTIDPEHRQALSKRFVREAQVAAQLHHPNIVTIHDIVFTPETGFIVMEFVEGTTLQSLLAKERLPLATAVEIAAQLGSALHYAHEHKIIHRDVKPANVLITPEFEARITDFGIAKADGSTQLTMSGSLVGTPDYMSPEQAKGEDVDARADIFSLGCVLYECTVGDKPFKGGSLTGVLLNIVNGDPFQSPAFRSSRLPSGLETVLRRALAKDPAGRFASAAELVSALRGLSLETRPGDERAEEPGAPAARMPSAEDRRTILVPPERPEPCGEREELLRRLKQEDRPLKFASTLSDELQDVSLTPAQGFILSRIDGASRARDILALSPIPEAEVAETLAELLDLGLLTWAEGAPAPESRTTDSATRRGGEKTRLDRKKYARELFQLAMKAYEVTDYWEAIQLVRQAVELDPERAEYHRLLGLGLMKNRNWLTEAEESLRRAAELDPTDAETFGLLAAVYKQEGLAERSASMLEKARALDPGYC